MAPPCLHRWKVMRGRHLMQAQSYRHIYKVLLAEERIGGHRGNMYVIIIY